MIEFAYGTHAQFQELDYLLSEGKVLRFANRLLPDSCSPKRACLWFGKIGDSYKVFIDKGVVTTKGNDDFRRFLQRGVMTFLKMEEMISFFHSIKPLFQKEIIQCANTITKAGDITLKTEKLIETQHCSQLRDKNSNDVIDKSRLDKICSEEENTKQIWPDELSIPLKKMVFGQDAAIDNLADLIVINQMRKEKKLLVITLLGPTATGKSETAKNLAKIMSDIYGRQYGFIEIAGSELIGSHTIHRFFGAPPGYVGHGGKTILAPVRKNPYHVIVINEIEKADIKILVGLMEAIDTGLLGMSDNSNPINLKNCILLFTSNIPIDMEKYEAATSFERSEMCRDAFTKHCGKPEISGKMENFLVFSPLNRNALIEIIIKFIREELQSYELILAHIDERLMADFLNQQTKYGARGIRNLVSDSVGRYLLNNKGFTRFKGKRISLLGRINNIKIEENLYGE